MTRRRSKKAKHPPGPEKLSLKGYAEHRGVSRASVKQAIDEGRVPKSAAAKGKNGRWIIDVAAADEAWAANTRRPKDVDRSARDLADSNPKLADHPLQFGPGSIPVDEEGNPLPPMMVQAIKTAVDAQVKQLELEQLRGSLVPADAVGERFRHIGQQTRDKILAVPKRIASKVASLSDPAEVEIVIERELNEALLALVDDAREEGAA